MICGQAHLTAAIECLGDALVPADAARLLLTFAGDLPEAASGHILECRLAGGACDYSLVLTRGDGGFELFAEHLDDAPFWRDTARLLAATRRQLRDAGLVWLEFDTGTGGVARPGFFVAPRADDIGPDAGLRLARALSGLFGLCPVPDVAVLTARLPAGSRLKQIGFMAGRSADSLRLVIEGIPPSGTRDFLAATGWPGATADAEELIGLAETMAGDAPCRLDIDLGIGVGHGLGIEIAGHALRADAIHGLTSAGMCPEPAAVALAACLDRRTLGRHGAGGDRRRLDFGLNHLKLARSEGSVLPEAKAYFSLLMLPDFSGTDLYHADDTSGE